MRMLTAVVAGFATIGLALDSHATAHQSDQQRTAVGSKVTLSACVQKAQEPGTFILTHVADMPVHPRADGRVVYWLDRVDQLRAHVGEQVRIEGEIAKIEQSEMDLEPGDDGKGGWYVEIEGPGQNVETTPEKAGVPTAGRKDKSSTIKTTLVRLNVGRVVTAARSCQGR